MASKSLERYSNVTSVFDFCVSSCIFS